MNKLLGVFIDTILPLIILVIGLVFAFVLYHKLKKKYNKQTPTPQKSSGKPQVKLKGRYATEQEMIFLDALHKALPRDCISFPHVGVANLIEPKGNLTDYKIITSKFVDICIFLRKDMTPILVIDLFEPSPAAQQLKKFDTDVSNVLKEVKIPVLHKQIEKNYNIENLRMEILNTLDNKTLLYLKDKFKQDIVKKQ